jgi:hypothetical protein
VGVESPAAVAAERPARGTCTKDIVT